MKQVGSEHSEEEEEGAECATIPCIISMLENICFLYKSPIHNCYIPVDVMICCTSFHWIVFFDLNPIITQNGKLKLKY